MTDDGLDWIREGLKRPGKTRIGLARALGRSPSMVTDLLNQERQLRANEIPAAADYLGVSPAGAIEVPLMGFIGAGAQIDPDFEQVPEDGLDQIALPYPVQHGLIGFKVKGDSMRPRYDEGDVVLCWRVTPRGIEGLYGEELAVRTSNNLRYLKYVRPGSRKGTVDLESLASETIRGVKLAWFSDIHSTIRAGQFRRLNRVAIG